MSAFKYGFWKKLSFAREKRRQVASGRSLYVEEVTAGAESYWSEVDSIPLPDAAQNDVLSDFARKLVTARKETSISDFHTRAPEDIYPVF